MQMQNWHENVLLQTKNLHQKIDFIWQQKNHTLPLQN